MMVVVVMMSGEEMRPTLFCSSSLCAVPSPAEAAVGGDGIRSALRVAKKVTSEPLFSAG